MGPAQRRKSRRSGSGDVLARQSSIGSVQAELHEAQPPSPSQGLDRCHPRQCWRPTFVLRPAAYHPEGPWLHPWVTRLGEQLGLLQPVESVSTNWSARSSGRSPARRRTPSNGSTQQSTRDPFFDLRPQGLDHAEAPFRLIEHDILPMSSRMAKSNWSAGCGTDRPAVPRSFAPGVLAVLVRGLKREVRSTRRAARNTGSSGPDTTSTEVRRALVVDTG